MVQIKCHRIHLYKNPIFQRFFFFWSFDAQKDGFLNSYRPFIGLDVCHLRGPYSGVLLSVVSLNANNNLFPLAVCTCDERIIIVRAGY